jgi:tetratricopeptide (TPR) repeat protein
MNRSIRVAAGLLIALPVLAAAQAIGPGFELERSGRYADAANVYLTTIHTDPVNIPALLGLERTLFVLNRMPELLPLVQAARARLPDNVALRSLELRVYAALNEPDSVEAIARRWAGTAPRSETPYREWGLALVDHRMFADARRAYLAGRQALGGEGTLAIELAELEQRANNWEAAATEWARAVTKTPEVEPNAASQLADTPSPLRDRVEKILTAPSASLRTRRMAGDVLLAWGQPADAWAVFEPTLAADSDAQTALRRFADLAGTFPTPEGHRVRGLALARWADLVPSPVAEQARAEAVRELLEGGDRVAARRVLESHAGQADAGQASLLRILMADGQLDVVEQRLSGPVPGLTADDRAALRIELANARIAHGDLDRATAALGDDSSVAALAVRGWIALYRGKLKEALSDFRQAGPYGDRAASTERTAMLALLQHVQAESSPELGAALLTLARGDSVAAIAALRRAATRLQPGGGRLEILLLSGQLAAAKGGEQEGTAIAVFDEIVRAGSEGESGSAAPAAAELEWARLLVRQNRPADAVPHLEHLILSYPNSAFVPEARRVLERAKGAIPKS